ncbi:MAG: hypothetical protein UY65_C0002G0010 [Parcubacteria group bacterium GW2011_GWA2_51_12]|nr:MAG: hypothetical protein UY65_C0002G0010 [Parcubacteria group bacterium GW2011_GWA2_51_12]
MKSLSDSLSEKFSRKDDLSRQLWIVKVFDLYRKELARIFGSVIGEPRILKQGVLHVDTSSPSAASELRLREREIIDAINTQLKKPELKKITYRF